jgi:carboxyl-terminal processing protease
MKKKTVLYSFIFFTLVILVIFITPQKIIRAAQQSYNKWMILTMIIDKIERFYVDDTSSDELFENAIHGILAGLDPHSVYLSAEEYSEWKKKFEGYQGLGISYNIIEDKLVVVSLIDDSPAAEAGMHLGDRIVEIAGRPIVHITNEEIQRILSGPIGTLIELKVQRDGEVEPLLFRIPLRQVQVESIPCAFLLNDSTGYIKILHFADSTPTELDMAFAKLNAQDMKRLILDLRNNSGGTLDAAIAVADRLLTGGKLIVFTKGRALHSSEQYMSTDENTLPMKPLIVLVNEATASDAEIVSGAVQDWDRGFVIGQKTFGKALVQTEYMFQDGSALLLTTARYYTPLGRMIQRDYFTDQGFGSPQSGKKNQSAASIKKYRTPKGRVVYGGGGITPDIIIPGDNEKVTDIFQKIYLSKEHYFYRYADQYVRDHLDSITKDVNVFVKSFEVSDDMLNEFRQELVDAGLELSLKELRDNRETFRFTIKREIAGRLWAEEGRCMAGMARDTQLAKSLQYFNQAKQLLTPAQKK